MKIVLYISSITVFVFTILYFVNENISAEWRKYQLAYRASLQELDGDEAQRELEFSIEMRQIYLPEMHRVDRCVSCHAAIDDPRYADGENPLKMHPGDYFETHDVEKLGCTICHDGQGRAITWEDALARADGKYWEKPILSPPFLAANCYRCHTDTLAQTPIYNRGKRLFETSGCLGCHQRDGKGGYLAPEFRGVGDASYMLKHPTDSLRAELLAQFDNNRNLAYIYESVRFPALQPTNSVMIDYGFSHEDAIALTTYLKSFTASQPGVIRLPPAYKELLPLIERGKMTYHLYCRACHGPEGEGGVKNPNYINGTIPELNLVAERMFLYEKFDADEVMAALKEFGDLNLADPPPDVPRYPVVLAQYNAIRDVILNGNPAARLDSLGPAPFNMPSWKKSISVEDINAVIAYLISTYEFEDEEE